MSEIPNSHMDVCRDLARHLAGQGYKTWVEVKRVGQQTFGDAGRIDVLALAPWTGRTSFSMIAFEVKVQRSDLLQDVQKGKWRRYASEYGVPHIAFAFPEGLAKPEDVPADAGLWIRRDGAWKRTRAPKALAADQRKIDPLLLLALLSQNAESASLPDRFERRFMELPASVREAVKDTPDTEFANMLRYGGLSRRVGHELAYRLAREPDAAVQVNAWAEAVAEEAATFLGVESSVVKHDCALGRYEPFLAAIRKGFAFYRQRELQQRLLSALDHIGGDQEYGQKLIADGLAIADAINASRDEQLGLVKRKKRGAA